jgi:hypothetical protein
MDESILSIVLEYYQSGLLEKLIINGDFKKVNNGLCTTRIHTFERKIVTIKEFKKLQTEGFTQETGLRYDDNITYAYEIIKNVFAVVNFTSHPTFYVNNTKCYNIGLYNLHS